MNRLVPTAALACASLLAIRPNVAAAHAVAGDRVFPVTLTLDDPGVSDEASLPTFTWQRFGANGGPGPVNEYTFGAEYDKRITERLGIGINWGYDYNDVENGKGQYGFQDLNVTVKYQTYVNAPHEFIVSLGLIREFARTGSSQIDADTVSNTTPTVYFGKGLGDIPVDFIRPFAITGTAGYSISDEEQKGVSQPPSQNNGMMAMPMQQQFNNGYSNRYVAGFSIQYSLPYLQSQVRDVGLGPFFGRMIPLVEITYSSPTRSNDLPNQLQFAPGVIYLADTYQVGIEALIPGNKATGTNVGVIAQFHMFFDDLFPNTLGKPLLDW